MVLLIEPVGIGGASLHAMRIVEVDVGGVEAFDHLHAVDQRHPGLAAVGRFMHAAADMPK